MHTTLLDGGMGQELLACASARPTGLWATQVLMDRPELVRAVHRDYFSAGTDIATTNSYAIHRGRLKRFGAEKRFADLHRQACQIAVSARDQHGCGLAARSMGPTGWSYRPDLAPPAAEAAALFAEIAHLQAPYLDLILLVNCSVPEALGQAIPLLANRGVPVGGYANGFVKITKGFTMEGATVDIPPKRVKLDPGIHADFAQGWIKDGAAIVGGCREVGPAHIAELARRLKGR
jgi:homocysteine S-methyltransferase